MSNKEKCTATLDQFTESQLDNILNILQSVKNIIDESKDNLSSEPDKEGTNIMDDLTMEQDSVIELEIDETLKKEADALFSELGLDTPTAIRIFLNQAVLRQAIPFEIKL